jgi:hypothetical protein
MFSRSPFILFLFLNDVLQPRHGTRGPRPRSRFAARFTRRPRASKAPAQESPPCHRAGAGPGDREMKMPPFLPSSLLPLLVSRLLSQRESTCFLPFRTSVVGLNFLACREPSSECFLSKGARGVLLRPQCRGRRFGFRGVRGRGLRRRGVQRCVGSAQPEQRRRAVGGRQRRE